MESIHKNLASGTWQKLSLAEQLANIGSEVSRVINLSKMDDRKNKEKAIKRVLELIDLTISDKRWKARLLEILRLREVFCDIFMRKNNYDISHEKFIDYFLNFASTAKK